MITNFVSVNDQDLESLLYLQKQGIEVEIRKVPADRKIYLMDILEKRVVTLDFSSLLFFHLSVTFINFEIGGKRW